MANLIIKPTSGGSLILQDEGGDAALTVGTTGSTTLAGTANNLGTVTGGTIGTGVTKKIHGFSAYNSSEDCAIPTGTWTEASATGTWTERFDSLTHYASGRFTPTVQGIYLCGYSAVFREMDANEFVISAIRRNSIEAERYAWSEDRNAGTGSGYDMGLSGSAIIQLDTDDYVSLWVYHNEGATQNLISVKTQFWAVYQGQV